MGVLGTVTDNMTDWSTYSLCVCFVGLKVTRSPYLAIAIKTPAMDTPLSLGVLFKRIMAQSLKHSF